MSPRSLLATVAATLLVSVGCSAVEPLPDQEPTITQAEARSELQARPGAREIERRAVAVLRGVVVALEGLAPQVTYDDAPPVALGETLCADPDLRQVAGATTRTFGTGGSGAVPDGLRDRMPDVVLQASRAAGWPDAELVSDRSSGPQVVVRGPDDAELEVSSSRTTSVTLRTGCYLDPRRIPESRR